MFEREWIQSAGRFAIWMGCIVASAVKDCYPFHRYRLHTSLVTRDRVRLEFAVRVVKS